MGIILDIGCSECNYSKEYFLGIGEFFRQRENKSIEIVNKLAGIERSKVIIEESIVQVFRCFSCNSLYNKMEINYKVKDNLSAKYNILYKCFNCKLPLYPLFNDSVFIRNYSDDQSGHCENIMVSEGYELDYYENILKDIRCYNCGKRNIYLKSWGEFD